MRINSACIVGAGAIGSLLAAHVGTVVPTSVLVRRQAHADQLNGEGLTVSGKARLHTRVRAATSPASLGSPDLVVIATKAAEVANTARTLAGHFPAATIMTIQNGLGCEETVAAHGAWPIVSAVTFMSGNRQSDVHVEYELDTATWLGPWAGRQATFEDARDIEVLLVRSGLKAQAFADVRPAQWSKLLFNSTVNSIGAVTDLPHVKDFAARGGLADLGHLVHAMMSEGKQVAAALGIQLYEDPWEMNVRAVSHGSTGDDAYAHVFSMLDDVRHRRPTEVDWLTGAVVREAARLGIAVPIHETLYRLVKAREASWKFRPPDGWRQESIA